MRNVVGFRFYLAAALIGLVLVTGVGAATVIAARRAGLGSQAAREIVQLRSPDTELGDLGNVLVEVDASAAGARTISPYIYGVANADQASKGQLDVDQLYVTDLQVGQGPSLRRFMPRAMGRAFKVLKKTSHVFIVVGDEAPGRKKPAKKARAPQAKG